MGFQLPRQSSFCKQVIKPIHLDYRIIHFNIAECFVLCEICFWRKEHLHWNRTGGANTSSLVQLIARRTPFQDNISKYRCTNLNIIVCHIFKHTLPNIDFFLFSQTNFIFWSNKKKSQLVGVPESTSILVLV